MTDIVEAAAEIERLTADREKWKASWLETHGCGRRWKAC